MFQSSNSVTHDILTKLHNFRQRKRPVRLTLHQPEFAKSKDRLVSPAVNGWVKPMHTDHSVDSEDKPLRRYEPKQSIINLAPF